MIFLQLWHVGRVSDPMFLDGALTVAPSAIPAKGNVSRVCPERPFVVPRALERGEIAGIVIANQGLDEKLAQTILLEKKADLVERLRGDAALAKTNMKTIYAPGAIGYTNYPTLAAQPTAG